MHNLIMKYNTEESSVTALAEKGYKELTLDYLREKLPNFNEVSDKVLINLYKRYSQLFFSANWMNVDYINIYQFDHWATKSPLQQELEHNDD